MASTAAEISTNNHSGSSRTPRVRVVKGGRYGLSKARQFARTAGTVLVIAIFFGLFASIVASQARITQLSGEIDDAKSELTNAQSYNDYLSTTMDQITNSTSVQQEAEDRLGLVKMDLSQVTYVRLEDESVIERAAGTADKFFAGIKTAALSLLGSFDPYPIRSRQYRITLGAQAVRWESCGAALTLRQSVHPNRSTLFLPSWAGAYSCKQSFL